MQHILLHCSLEPQAEAGHTEKDLHGFSQTNNLRASLLFPWLPHHCQCPAFSDIPRRVAPPDHPTTTHHPAQPTKRFFFPPPELKAQPLGTGPARLLPSLDPHWLLFLQGPLSGSSPLFSVSFQNNQPARVLMSSETRAVGQECIQAECGVNNWLHLLWVRTASTHQREPKSLHGWWRGFLNPSTELALEEAKYALSVYAVRLQGIHLHPKTHSSQNTSVLQTLSSGELRKWKLGGWCWAIKPRVQQQLLHAWDPSWEASGHGTVLLGFRGATGM